MDSYQQFAIYQRVEIGKGERTIQAYLGDVQRFRSWLDNHAVVRGLPPSWEEIEARHIRGYTAWLSSDHVVIRSDGRRVEGRAVGPKYIRRITSSLQVWFDYLRDIEKRRGDNPAREVRAPKLPRRHPPYLASNDVAKLVRVTAEHSRTPERLRNWAMIAFLYNTGLRVSELCAMRLSDIRYRERLPHSVRVIGKGNKEDMIVLNTEAKRALYQWLEERAHIEAAAPLDADTSYVWLVPAGRKRGHVITPGGVRAVMRRMGSLAGLERSNPHVMRHSFANALIRGGAKAHAVQKAMRHSSLSTTGQYFFADESDLEQAVALVPGVLTPLPEGK